MGQKLHLKGLKSVTTAVSSLLLSTGLLTSTFASAAVENKKIDEPFKPLKFSIEHPLTSNFVRLKLISDHYVRQPIDDQLSSKVYDRYIESLDSTKSYLLASDIEEFNKYRFRFDDFLKRSELNPAFHIFNRYQQRVVERISFALKTLDAGISNFDFTKNEELELDREKLPWASTSSDLDDLWRKRLKHTVLNLKLAGKKPEKIQEMLVKRYQNQLNRVHQTNSEDAFQTYMNAFTGVFDPHTQYLSPRNSENFNINMSLSLQGIGAVLQAEDEYTKIRELVPAGPADKTGELEPSDRIIGVAQGNDEMVDVIGWRLDEVVKLIRGPKGSTVRLEVLVGSSDSNSKIVTIVRDEVKLEEQAAKSEIIEIQRQGRIHKIGVIDIPTFYLDFRGYSENRPDYKSTTRDVRRLITELNKENIDGLVIDLRNNSGGSLSEANALVGLFIPKGPTVQIRTGLGQVEVLEDTDPSTFYDGPLTVMVNRLSASASEIFAGAIQDYGRGLVVGGQTFGKGTVQSLRPLTHGQLKITQAKFYRISGGSTQHQGVVPDIAFPELYDKEKIGESSLEDALPWDTIRPANYLIMGNHQALLSNIKSSHDSRVKQNPDFIYLNKQIALLEELRNQTKVSLNEATRKRERKESEDRRLALENERRKAKGLELLDSLKDEDEEEEKVASTVNTEADRAQTMTNDVANEEVAKDKPDTTKKALEEEEEADALLVETGNILLDYIQATDNLLAQRPPVDR